MSVEKVLLKWYVFPNPQQEFVFRQVALRKSGTVNGGQEQGITTANQELNLPPPSRGDCGIIPCTYALGPYSRDLEETANFHRQMLTESISPRPFHGQHSSVCYQTLPGALPYILVALPHPVNIGFIPRAFFHLDGFHSLAEAINSSETDLGAIFPPVESFWNPEKLVYDETLLHTWIQSLPPKVRDIILQTQPNLDLKDI